MRIQILSIFFCSMLLYDCQQPTAQTRPVRRDVIETVFASGELDANNTYKLTAQNDGYLVEVGFEEGDLVKKGQILAIVENPEDVLNAKNADALYGIAMRNAQSNTPALLQAQTSVENARQKLEQDRLQKERYKRLLESNSIALSEYETAALNVETAGNNLESAVQLYKKLELEAQQQTVSPQNNQQLSRVTLDKNTIRAVERGKVYQKFKQKGDFVKYGDVIASIGDPDLIYATVHVDEGSISKVKVGQNALVQLNTQPSRNYRARVREILPTFDDAQQSFVCKLQFEEPLDFTVIKTQLQTNITIDTQHNALLIPRSFLEYGGFVQLKGQKGKVKVETNFISSDWVQVLSGIDENAELITTNINGAGAPSGGDLPGTQLY